MALIGKARGAGPGPVAGPYASVPPDSLWAAVSSMEGLPPVQGPRTALRDSQRLKSSTVALPKRSEQRLDSLLNRGGRCAAN